MAHMSAPAPGASPLMPTHVFDVTIIGGGPVGLFAAFYAGLRQMSTKIIDSLEELGGQLTALYPEKYVFDVAGFPKIYARDLAKNLIQQAMEYQPTVSLGETARTLEVLKGAAENEPAEVQGVLETGATVYKITSERMGGGFSVHYTRTLVITAGAGAFAPRKLPIKDAVPFENKGVYYACRSKSVFTEKRVLIVGGGDSAVDWALNLRDITHGHDGSGISLILRRNQFRAHENSVRQLQATRAHIMTYWELESIVSENGRLTGAVIFNNQTKEKRTLHVDAVLAQFGFQSSLGPIEKWPIKIEKKSIVVSRLMETELPGVFAAGDVAHFEGKLKLIATGFGEAAVAVNVAKTRIDPHAKVFPGHSSEMTSQAESVVTV